MYAWMVGVECADGAEDKLAGSGKKTSYLNSPMAQQIPKTGKEFEQWRPSLRYFYSLLIKSYIIIFTMYPNRVYGASHANI